MTQQRRRSRWPSRIAAVRTALWLALLVAAAGVGLLTREIGAGLLAGGLATAAVLFFVVDADGRAGEDR